MNACEEIAVLPAAPAGSRGGIPIGGTVLGPDGGPAIGIVDKVVLSPQTGEVTHLLIRCFGKVPHDALVPMTRVGAVHGRVVQLSMPVEQLNCPAALGAETTAGPAARWATARGYEPEQVLFTLLEPACLPAGRTDADLLRRAVDALRSCDSTRQLLLALDSEEPVTANRIPDQTMHIVARDGVVILAGNVELSIYAGIAERLVRRVPGVREVLNLLIADDELKTSVVAAIYHDPRTRQLQPRVSVERGGVTLNGSVPDDPSRDALGEVVGSVHGVRDVVNRLRVGR